MSNGSDDFIPLDLIEARQRDIAALIKDAEAKIAALQSEQRELEVVERVIIRLKGYAPSVTITDERPPKGKPETAAKPPNTPTIPDMIFEALRVAYIREQKIGLGPKAITDYIAEKWWPNVKINAVGPVIWRMWKRGQLTKPDPARSLYSLPKDGAPGSEEPSATDHHDDAGGTVSSSGSNEGGSLLAALPGASPAQPGE